MTPAAKERVKSAACPLAVIVTLPLNALPPGFDTNTVCPDGVT